MLTQLKVGHPSPEWNSGKAHHLSQPFGECSEMVISAGGSMFGNL